MDLFSSTNVKQDHALAPLAVRMRPQSLDDFFGQKEIIGHGKPLRRAIASDNAPSMIFYGPPGTGKTTLAKLIATTTKACFEQLNAVSAGVADIRRLAKEAKERLTYYRQRTIVFIDEIHRFNKGQQDALLPFVEDGTVTLVGATTENPYFEVNSPLLSRCRVFVLKELQDDDIRSIIRRALEDSDNGYGGQNITLEEDALEYMIRLAGGDARSALNMLEIVVQHAQGEGQGCIVLSAVEEAVQQKAVRYDKGGDNHYDTISAFIKSMRGSDPDAALYWLAKMLTAGEDIKFIARRIVICAAEDVGNADPQALVVANAAAQAAQFIGMPEARIILAQAVTYVACAPKSNASYMGINQAMQDVQNLKTGEVPLHLRDASYRGAQKLGHGRGYLYPHEYKNHYIKQNYLPEHLYGRQYYQPTSNGYERNIKNHLERLKNDSGQAD